MRHAIEVEEVVRIRHRIVVDDSNDEAFENALNVVEYSNFESFDDLVESVSEVVEVYEVDASIDREVECFEYLTDYLED